MESEPTEAAKVERFAKPKAIGCAVAFGLVLAVIVGWALGFFSWLVS